MAVTRGGVIVRDGSGVVGRSSTIVVTGSGVTCEQTGNTTTIQITSGGGGTPASSVVAETSFGAASAVGVHANYARQDHTHGTPANPVTAHEAAGDPHPQYTTAAELATAVSDHAAAADPHTGYQKESEKGAALGYPSLDVSALIPIAQMPVVSIAKGGTGQATAAAGFDALSPTTTLGDISFRGVAGNERLAKGTAGQVLTMNAGATAPAWATPAAGGGGGFTVIKRTTDLARSLNAVAAADPVLSIPLAAATGYIIRGSVFYSTNATADFKWRHAYTGSTTTYRLRRSAIVPAATAYTLIAIDAAVSAADIAMLAAAGTIGFFEWECTVVTATAGTWSINWAQNTSNAGAASVLAGSYIEYATL